MSTRVLIMMCAVTMLYNNKWMAGVGVSGVNFAQPISLQIPDGCSHRKTMKMTENLDLETLIYTWFMQVRGQGQPKRGPFIYIIAFDNTNTAFPINCFWIIRRALPVYYIKQIETLLIVGTYFI